MRSRSTLLIVALALDLVLLFAFAFPAAPAASAQCAATYVVRPGDWLSAIALRNNTSLYVLLQLNPTLRFNPNFIYPGQVICLPAGSPPPVQRNNQVALEVTYSYTPTVAEASWNLARGGLIGKRSAYRLENSLQGFVAVSTTEQISMTATGSFQPVLLGFRTDALSTEYNLVAVDRTDILTSLAISPTYASGASIFQSRYHCQPQPLSVLSDRPARAVTGALVLEPGNGLRFPFPVVNVGYANASELATCYGSASARANLVFALYPAPGGAYRMQMLLTQEGFGPPGYVGSSPRCSGWGGNWYEDFLRAWYGC